MKKIAFIRSLEVEKTQPYLGTIGDFAKENNLQLKLFYTDGKCDSKLFCGEYQKLDKDISCEALVKEIVAWEPDSVISISVPDDNSVRDACAKKILEENYNIPTIMHSLESTMIMSNKWLTKQLLKSLGFETPEGILVDGDQLNGRGIQYVAYRDYLIHSIRKFGYPVIVKAIWDSLSADTQVFNDENEFANYLKKCMNKNFIVEKYVKGTQCMLEFLAHRGEVYFQPLIAQCVSSVDSFIPFHHYRCAPALRSDYDKSNLQERFKIMACDLNLSGAVNVDFIYKDGKFYILEINPRVSGITTLSISSSGVNTYQSLLEMALSQWLPDKSRRRIGKFAIEIPINPQSEAVMSDVRKIPEVLYIKNLISWNSVRNIEHSMMHLRCDSAIHCNYILVDLQRKYHIIDRTKFGELKSALLNYKL